MRRVHLAACLLLAAAGGCAYQTTTPLPKTLPSAGILVRCNHERLNLYYQVREYELLTSDVSNDLYPFNILSAQPSGKLVPRLYAWRTVWWEEIDFAELPHERRARKAHISRDGRRIIYERPEVGTEEGEFPRSHDGDRRVYRVAIYDHAAKQRFVLDGFTSVSGLGGDSHWRRDGSAVAFTTDTCLDGKPAVRELVVLDACGQVLLSSRQVGELAGLEFIGFSPDGTRLAALRPAKAQAGACHGGVLVEVDVAKRTASDIGEMPGTLAAEHAGRLERAVKWDDNGHCSVRPE